MKNEKKIGLALSGGGFRATAYHLGTLKKLKEMNILDKIDVISTISGGSITGAYYGLYGNNFEKFENGTIDIVKQNVLKHILTSSRFVVIASILFILLFLILFLLFTKYAWCSTVIFFLTIYIIIKNQYKLFPVSKILNGIYSKFFFSDKKLKDLNASPIIAINATNIETGTPFTFSKNKMSDSKYEYDKPPIIFKPDEFPISLAVSASTCVPFAFSPISIDKEFFINEDDYKKVKPSLVDGGVYDNQGLHKLTQKGSSYECDIIIVSDAGNIMPRFSSFSNTIELLIRTSEIFMNRIKNYQMINSIYVNYQLDKKQIAYQSLGWDLDKCVTGFIENLKKGLILESVIKDHNIDPILIENKNWYEIEIYIKTKIGCAVLLTSMPTNEELKIARDVKTSLTPLNDIQINALIKQAMCMTEIQIKLYCPNLLN